MLAGASWDAPDFVEHSVRCGFDLVYSDHALVAASIWDLMGMDGRF